jgi:hypothetical protein
MTEHAKKESDPAAGIGWGGHIMSLLGATHGVEHALPFLGPVGSFLGAAGAGAEAYENFHEGRTLDGALKAGEAGLDFGAGVAESAAIGLAGTAAAGTAGTVGAVLGGAALGIGSGMGMEKATKYSGLYKDAQGNAMTGSDFAAKQGNALAQWIDPNQGTTTNGGLQDGLFSGNFSLAGARHTAGFLGGIAGTLAGVPAAAGMDLLGTGAAAVKGIGSLFGGGDDKNAAPGPYDHFAD